MKWLNASEKKERNKKWWQKGTSVANLHHCVIRWGMIIDRPVGIKIHTASQVLDNTQMRDCNIQKLTEIKPFIDRLLRFPKNMQHLPFSSFFPSSEWRRTEHGTQNTRPDQYSYLPMWHCWKQQQSRETGTSMIYAIDLDGGRGLSYKYTNVTLFSGKLPVRRPMFRAQMEQKNKVAKCKKHQVSMCF